MLELESDIDIVRDGSAILHRCTGLTINSFQLSVIVRLLQRDSIMMLTMLTVFLPPPVLSPYTLTRTSPTHTHTLHNQVLGYGAVIAVKG